MAKKSIPAPSESAVIFFAKIPMSSIGAGIAGLGAMIPDDLLASLEGNVKTALSSEIAPKKTRKKRVPKGVALKKKK